MSKLSTRSQILFRNTRRWENDDGETQERTEELLTYKHSDGYPSSVIPLLREYYQWSGRTNDFEYFTATWFYYNKRRYEYFRVDGRFRSDEIQEQIENREVPHMETGYGICADRKIHGDIEHLYVVDLPEGEIEHYSLSWGSARDADSAGDFVSDREPKEVYSLTPNTDLPHQPDFKKYFEDHELKRVEADSGMDKNAKVTEVAE